MPSESPGGPASGPGSSSGVGIALIAAVAENGVIGQDGDLPWHYPEDMARFKETTMGHPVVMGRVTYESIVEDLGGPLPGRANVVLTTGDLDLPEGAVAVHSVDAALDAAREAIDEGDGEQGTVYVAGGASVYEQFLPRADRLVLTKIHESPEGDTYFPEVDWTDWEVLAREDREDLSFLTYERRE